MAYTYNPGHTLGRNQANRNEQIRRELANGKSRKIETTRQAVINANHREATIGSVKLPWEK